MEAPPSRALQSKDWVKLQQAHIDCDAAISSKKLTGERWLHKVLHHLWSHLYTAWKQRNADLHGLDTADQERKRKAKLKPAIVALYNTAASLDYLDKRLFTLPLSERLTLRSHEQEAWINVVTPTVRQAKAEAADHTQRMQHDIREFLLRPANIVPRAHAVQIDERRPVPRLPVAARRHDRVSRPPGRARRSLTLSAFGFI